jgi:enediyne biosynthesis protein E4
MPVSVIESGFLQMAKAKAELFTKDNKPMVLVGRNNNALKYFTASATAKVNTLLKLQPVDWQIEFILAGGRKRVQEIYYGCGYLSQSSRQISVPANTHSVIIKNYQGLNRKVDTILRK